MDTYEFYVKVPVYVPFRCDAPDIGTARDFEKRIKKYWPAFLRDRCKVTVPGIRKVQSGEEGTCIYPEKALITHHFDWLGVAESLGIVKDPGEELQYRE